MWNESSDMSADTYFTLRMEDGSQYAEVFARDCSMYRFFRIVSRKIAFSDCSCEDVGTIVYRGIEYVYEGWEPGELYKYHAVHDASVKWEMSFPEFNH